MNDFILCGVKDCAYSSTHTIDTFGFCCKHFEEFTHAFTHKEFEKFAGKFDWNIKLYEKGIQELKDQIAEDNRQYQNLAQTCHELLSKKANAKTRRKTRV